MRACPAPATARGPDAAPPEAYIGGPLALVRTGDIIALDVEARSITLEISDAEMATRRAALKPPAPRYERGYGWMFSQHIRQANEGCDFDFLETSFGKPVPSPRSTELAESPGHRRHVIWANCCREHPQQLRCLPRCQCVCLSL